MRLVTSALRSLAVGLVAVSSVACSGCGAVTRTDGGRGLLPVGALAPDLEASDQLGKTRRVMDERGHALVVYFYPKDGTPGCTHEACAFRDAWDKFKSANVQIFGVSSDDTKSHEQFAKEQRLPFPILADPDHRWAAGFGVRSTLGMDQRVTFLLGKDGTVAKVYPDVDPGVHADQVLKDAAGLR
jgi:peroxiredoxin Q/BCP